MGTIKKVLISGLGAIGSSYASRFYESDPDCLGIIADRERIGRYREKGVAVNGKVYPFRYIQPDAAESPADLIMIAVKQHHLEQCIRDIRNFVSKDTIILSLLNGITSEEVVGREFGMDKLLFSFVVGTDAVREGTGTRFSKLGTIVFGERTNEAISPKVTAVKELLDWAGIPNRVPRDMMRELWWKFMMNVGINQTSAVLRAPYGVFLKVPEARALMESACREVLRLAEKVSITLSEEDITSYFAILGSLSPEGKTSMLQDVEAGRKTEVEIFAGTVVELGARYGIDTPVNKVLFEMIRTLEHTYPSTNLEEARSEEISRQK